MELFVAELSSLMLGRATRDVQLSVAHQGSEQKEASEATRLLTG